MMPYRLVLASGSKIRATILRNAGIPFESRPTQTNEAAIKQAGLATGAGMETIVTRLARAKAEAIVPRDGELVIGSDQILIFDNALFDKPVDIKEAKDRLAAMQGKTHTLMNATTILKNGELIYEGISTADLTIRTLTPEDIDIYFDDVGTAVLSSVGAYHLEGKGARLFEKIEGDYFTILGLPLTPLLPVLRAHGIIAY
ncbi:MAG: Maf family protein [Pseudomonadota bacterium]